MIREVLENFSTQPRGLGELLLGPRPVYVVENHDWPAMDYLQPDDEAYAAIITAYETVSDVQYDAAQADMARHAEAALATMQ